ncbi:MAG: hypothetical protein GXP47_02915 [Acidobacteria bacterium]|nr:hypothetical protein [Acidobacteriota bacterium]
MFKIDLHVHTGRYSQCAETVDPYRIEEHALRAGLDGVVLTDHDILWAEEELVLLVERSPAVRLFRGIEVSAKGAHLVIIGLEDAGSLHRGIPVADACNIAHGQAACVILAHPYRDADPGGLPMDLLDAVEVGSTSFTPQESTLARGLAKRFGKPQVASSDAHALSRIGWGWTELPDPPSHEGELAAMITSGIGSPFAPGLFP